jgi:hypothetical protein
MNKPEPFFWGGVSLTILGLVGTGVSAYFVATKPKNDNNETVKTVSLVLSIVLTLIGAALLFYYYMPDTSSCSLAEQLPENIQTEYPTDVAPAPPAPPPGAPVSFQINVNQPAQKPV